MSGAKAQFLQQITWIGWFISLDVWTILITDETRVKIIAQLQNVLNAKKIKSSCCLGEIHWQIAVDHFCVAPTPTTLEFAVQAFGIGHTNDDDSFPSRMAQQLLDHLSADGTVVSSFSHPGFFPGMKLFRAGNHNIGSLEHARTLYDRSQRIWIGMSDPKRTWKKPNAEVERTLQAWLDLLLSTSLELSLLPRPILQCQAAADAMA